MKMNLKFLQQRLLLQLEGYIRENNPELLLILLEENRLQEYLQESVSSLNGVIRRLSNRSNPVAMIEELCMEELTKSLRPSRYNYMYAVVEEQFPYEFEKLRNREILITELINMITTCDPIFDEVNFSDENKNDRYLRYAITGAVHEYLESKRVA